MEMTIAKPIQTLEYLRDSGVFPFSSKEGVLFTAESIDVAISTMQKYQKIQEIYERFQKDGNYYHHMAWIEVMEVLKDGNDD